MHHRRRRRRRGSPHNNGTNRSTDKKSTSRGTSNAANTARQRPGPTGNTSPPASTSRSCVQQQGSPRIPGQSVRAPLGECLADTPQAATKRSGGPADKSRGLDDRQPHPSVAARGGCAPSRTTSCSANAHLGHNVCVTAIRADSCLSNTRLTRTPARRGMITAHSRMIRDRTRSSPLRDRSVTECVPEPEKVWASRTTEPIYTIPYPTSRHHWRGESARIPTATTICQEEARPGCRARRRASRVGATVSLHDPHTRGQ